MGRNEALQQLRKAIAEHSSRFRKAWDARQWSKADEHWKNLLVLRSLDDRISRQNSS